MKPLAAIIIFFVFIVAIPLVTIAALNDLFALNIPVTVGTWASALWLGALVTGGDKATRFIRK